LKVKESVMTFTFDISKATAATGYLLALGEGKCNLIKLVKMLYVADRLALQSWHRTITGDRFYSMANGPVVSTIYNLIKGEAATKLQSAWNEYIGERRYNTISLVKMPDTRTLSDAERWALSAAFNKIHPMSTGQLVEWCHTFPEWRDPGKSSTRIDPKAILRLTTVLTADEIDAVEDGAEQAKYMTAMFGA